MPVVETRRHASFSIVSDDPSSVKCPDCWVPAKFTIHANHFMVLREEGHCPKCGASITCYDQKNWEFYQQMLRETRPPSAPENEAATPR